MASPPQRREAPPLLIGGVVDGDTKEKMYNAKKILSCDIMRSHLFISGLCCIFLLILGCTAGCVYEEEEKMNQVTSLVESAYDHLEVLNTTDDFETLYVGSIRAEMAAAEVDFTEALTVLESISYDYLSSEEREGMDAVKVMCQIDIDICEMMASDFCDFIDHSQKVSLAMDEEEAVDHFREARAALVRMKEKTAVMKTKIDTVEVDHLPSEIKGDFVGMKTYIHEFEKSLEEWIAVMDEALSISGL